MFHVGEVATVCILYRSIIFPLFVPICDPRKPLGLITFDALSKNIELRMFVIDKRLTGYTIRLPLHKVISIYINPFFDVKSFSKLIANV